MPARRLALSTSSLACIVAALGSGPILAAEPAGSVVPFELLPSRHMVVEARINGEGPYQLVFDLGSPVTLLSNKVGEAAGLIKPGAPRSFLFAMRGEARADKVQVGDLTVEKLPVLVMDHPALKALGKILKRPIDGLVGYTFFARYKTTIDYQALRMTFEPVDFQVRDLLADLPERLAGPKVARQRVLAPAGLWGLVVGPPEEDAPGVPILKVLPDSPAEAAGLKVGDVLTALDGRWTTSVADAYAAASAVPPGRAVPVVVVRDGEERTLTVTPRDGI